MSLKRRAGIRGPATIALVAITMTALTLGAAGSAATAAAPESTALYIVQLAGNPVATYSGGVAGFVATRPAAGKKINTHTANARSYSGYLVSNQNKLLKSSGITSKQLVYSYTTALNGVAVRLTATQAAKLRNNSGVSAVYKNQIHTVQSASLPPTAEFMGLTGKKGVWKTQFGDPAHAGEGVIIGDIDTGFWPENPSFAALPSPRADDAAIAAKFSGICDAGDDHQVTCNNKVIGARWYNASGAGDANPGEFHSPRDYDGHGSHTASTAAGNFGVAATVNGISVGTLSGVAPAARISVYKVLYERADGSTSSGGDVDIVAAIDQAVQDGVDVINFSVGDNVDTFGADELSFLNASAAGVFVSAAAGNAGPGAATVDNAMPWETTVAAGSFDLSHPKTITLGDGSTYTGIGVGPAVASAPLIDSVNVGLAAADPALVELCYSGTLDPAKVAGKIVLCKRGGNARTDKSVAVNMAGGVGMVLYNATPNTLNADFHFVPSIHVDGAAGTAIKAYIAGTASPTAAISADALTKVEAPVVADFSSAGPANSSGGSLNKPDIMGPGVDVVAAVSPANHAGNLWDSESGTSMATPHIAGIALLLKSKNPTWSPMDIKSAMMTTASTVDNAGNPIQRAGANATALDMGSGEVAPRKAFDPGLAYESDVVGWIQYSCGIGVHLFNGDTDLCDVVGTVDPSDLNYPSISIGALAGVQTVTRTVTNLTGTAGTYVSHILKPAGFKVTVSPTVLHVPAHGTATYTVTITRKTGTLGTFAFGSLTWKDGYGHSVRSPISVRAVALAAPVEVTGTGSSITLPLKSGFAGTLTASATGLAQSSVTSVPLQQGTGFSTTSPAPSASTSETDVTVPAGTQLARFQTFGTDYPAGADVDVFVYQVTGTTMTLVGTSAGGSADESVTVTEAGDYAMFVNVFAAPGDGSLTVKPNIFVVPNSNLGNFTATPASQSVTLGGAASVTASWTGLTAGNHYLGVVGYGDGTNSVGSTVVAVNP